MPKSIMEEESLYKLPEDTFFPAELIAVVEKEFPFTYKKGENAGQPGIFRKWEWEFKITEGEFAGLHAWGETEPKLTNHPDNKVRQWGEVLRDAPFKIGEGIDTDLLLALTCTITVSHEAVTRGDGSTMYKTPVKDVLPAGLAAEMNGEPPF